MVVILVVIMVTIMMVTGGAGREALLARPWGAGSPIHATSCGLRASGRSETQGRALGTAARARQGRARQCRTSGHPYTSSGLSDEVPTLLHCVVLKDASVHSHAHCPNPSPAFR